MISNYYTLRAVAGSLASALTGATLSALFTQERDEVVVTFDDGRPALLLSCRQDASTCYLHPAFARARRNSADVLNAAAGTEITRIVVHSSDRVIRIALSSGLTLAALFFGAQSNILLLSPDETIVDAFKQPKQLAGTRFDGRPDEGPFVYDVELVRQAAKDGRMTAGMAIRRAFPPLGSTLVHELMVRCEIDDSAPAASLTESDLTLIRHRLLHLLRELETPRPLVYAEPGGPPALFSIIRLTSASGMEAREFASIHDAIRAFLSGRRAVARVRDRKQQAVAALTRYIAKARRTRDAIIDEGREGERADLYQRYGTLLMEHLGMLRQGMNTAELPDGDASVRIPLDPKLPPVANAQRYFDRSKRARTAAHQAKEKLRLLEEKSDRAERLMAVLQVVETKDEVDKFMADNSEELEEFGIGKKAAEREQLPFRIFTVDGGFEVWAGKSSENNDLLTLRHARPHDLWFHARGAGGSHVVLKVDTGKGEPGKKAREQAASIAAYYSKMKNAGLVPVAMTEKRYVRKPKGAPPGTVTIEREKVLFVRPALPKGEQ